MPGLDYWLPKFYLNSKRYQAFACNRLAIDLIWDEDLEMPSDRLAVA